jgi:hypothetical protein
VIDNVPPQMLNAEGVINYAVVRVIKEQMGDIGDGKKGIQHVLQDRFHVAHSFSPKFNNLDVRFFDIIIKGFREVTVRRDQRREEIIDEALKHGRVAKKVTFRGVVYRVKKGECLSETQICEWKTLGVYHEMFSTGDVVVPEHVRPAQVLKTAVPEWVEEMIGELFIDDQPVKIFGRTLIPTAQIFRDLANNALSRMLNCVPPDGVNAWRLTGTIDSNGFEIMKPNFHTCGVESWNALQTGGPTAVSPHHTPCPKPAHSTVAGHSPAPTTHPHRTPHLTAPSILASRSLRRWRPRHERAVDVAPLRGQRAADHAQGSGTRPAGGHGDLQPEACMGRQLSRRP